MQYSTRPLLVGFVVDKVTLGHISVPVLQFSPVGIVPPVLRTHSLVRSLHISINSTCSVSGLCTYQLIQLVLCPVSAHTNSTCAVFGLCTYQFNLFCVRSLHIPVNSTCAVSGLCTYQFNLCCVRSLHIPIQLVLCSVSAHTS
jgi:hypothetical protein